MKTILDSSNNIEARKILLKQENYCEIDLPKYFVFDNLLDKLSKTITATNLSDIWTTNPKLSIDINYIFYTNKDGKFAWRPLQLINPVMYVFLVREITKKTNWELIVERFIKFQTNKQIRCCSIPVLSENDGNKTDKANTVLRELLKTL